MPIVIPNTVVKIRTNSHIISQASFEDSNLKKELITCILVYQLSFLTIKLNIGDR